MTIPSGGKQANAHPGGATKSVWQDTVEVPHFPKLQKSGSTDVCVIGAGIAGLTTAYHLAREGKRVTVLDDGPIGGGETGRTTAHLVYAMDDRISWLEGIHGEHGTRMIVESHAAAINRIQQIAQLEDIDCDFERLDGYLIAKTPGNTGEIEELKKEAEAAQRAGLTDVSLVDRAPIAGFESGTALRFPGQGQFHILKYLSGLARAIVEKYHGEIWCDTHVEAVEGGNPANVRIAGGIQLGAGCVVVCTNSSISDYVQTHVKSEANRSYVIGALVPRGSVEKALYWDMGEVYHYVRVQSLDGDGRETRGVTGRETGDAAEGRETRGVTGRETGDAAEGRETRGVTGRETGDAAEGRETSRVTGREASDTSGPTKGGTLWDVLLVGGEDHKVGHDSQPEDRWGNLERWMKQRWPQAHDVVYRWSGQIVEPSDGVAFIGKNPDGAENVYMAMGDSGQGMTHGTIAGMLLTDLIMGRENPWATLYDPKRVSLRATPVAEMAKHNLEVALQMVKGYVSPDLGNVDEIPRGEGRVIRRGLRKVAAYRDMEGRVHEKSAVCTHLKCIVEWNGMEKTWDCPCHGSRFAPTGEVLNGPAIMALEDVESDRGSKTDTPQRKRKARA